MSRRRLGEISLASLAGLAVLPAASGWLYLMGPERELPGPRIGDALPLDELSRRSAASLIAFLAVWGVAALLLGLLARLLRAEPLTAALLLALGVGGWGYLVTGASLLVVRQIPAESAFRAAGQVRAVYVAAALAGLGAALLAGRPGWRRARLPFVLAWFVAAAGGLGVLDAILPEHTGTLLAELEPGVHPLASALAAPLGMALVYVSPGLARGRRRSWQLAVALLLVSTTLHLLHGDYGAISTGLVLIALVARRQDFTAPGDPAARPRILVRAVLLCAAIYGYGAAALAINRVEADQPLTVRLVFGETSRALLGLGLRGSAHLSGGIGHWFAPSVLALGLASVAILLHDWLAPWRYRLCQEAPERTLASALVGAWGLDTLAPFVLRADKSYFIGTNRRAFLAYKTVGGVAIVSGDPIGPLDAFDELIAGFIEFAHERDWRVAILGVSERSLELYRRHGLHGLYHGDEAIVETAAFSLEGRPIRKVRQSVHRLRKAGFTADALHPRQVDPGLRASLEAIACEWRGDEPDRGFVMALDSLFRLEGEDAVFVIGRGPDGTPAGFLHFAVCRRASALSLSSMPRLRDTPNGYTEWLICEAVSWAREHGFARVSLNFAPFAALLAPEAELSRLEQIERRALLAMKGRFQLDNLLLFNRKFFPRWERRFVVYERRRDLPRVGIAALAAEAYLPFSGRERR
jgi:lysyl-tRNA synthetase class 2